MLLWQLVLFASQVMQPWASHTVWSDPYCVSMRSQLVLLASQARQLLPLTSHTV